MAKPSLEERAKNDTQLSRFISKEKKLAESRAKERTARKKESRKYAINHMPKTRNLSEEAAAAIDNCTLP